MSNVNRRKEYISYEREEVRRDRGSEGQKKGG
jgi:hypothetical protein